MEQADIAVETGKRIRHLRKKSGLTLEMLAQQIGKCRSMVSKYENGSATMDIQTLSEIADVLQVPVERLLYQKEQVATTIADDEVQTSFFGGARQFFGFYFDGRSQAINRTVFNVGDYLGKRQWEISVYMNYDRYDDYRDCENQYKGVIERYESITHIRVKNTASPLEQLHISILTNFQDDTEKWGLMYGTSSRPIMPIALKMFLSATPPKEDEEFEKMLKISKSDTSIMKQFNMFTVIPN